MRLYTIILKSRFICFKYIYNRYTATCVKPYNRVFVTIYNPASYNATCPSINQSIQRRDATSISFILHFTAMTFHT